MHKNEKDIERKKEDVADNVIGKHNRQKAANALTPLLMYSSIIYIRGFV